MPAAGHFLAGASEQAQALAPGTDTDAAALWVVLKWEGLAPLALYPSAQQTSGIGLGSLFGGQGAAVRDRLRMLRCAPVLQLAAGGWIASC